MGGTSTRLTHMLQHCYLACYMAGGYGAGIFVPKHRPACTGYPTPTNVKWCGTGCPIEPQPGRYGSPATDRAGIGELNSCPPVHWVRIYSSTMDGNGSKTVTTYRFNSCTAYTPYA